MSLQWTDNVAPGTSIRAAHINELRSVVNSLRAAAGMGAFPWTDRLSNGDLPTSSAIRAAHFIELRKALQDLWMRKGLGLLPGWGGPAPAVGQQVLALHTNKLREWTDSYRDAPSSPKDPQGIVTFTFQPAELVLDSHGDEHVDGPHRVGDPAWCQDILNLKPSGLKLKIRTKIASRHETEDDNSITSEYTNYRNAFQVWNDKGFVNIELGAVFPGEFHRASTLGSIGTWCPNKAVSTSIDGLTNDYIDSFADRAADFAVQVATKNVRTFWIWNEPNLESNSVDENQFCTSWDTWNASRSSLSPQVYGALVHKTSYAIRQAFESNGLGSPTIYAGSLSVIPDVPGDNPPGSAMAGYFREMYQHLNDHGVNSLTSPYGYGRDALSINLEGEADKLYDDPENPGEKMTFAQSAYRELSRSQVNASHPDWSDTKPIIVGEWGVPNDISYQKAESIFNAIRAWFTTMYFFAHYEDSNYGARNYDYAGATSNYITLDPPLSWYGYLVQLYQLIPFPRSPVV